MPALLRRAGSLGIVVICLVVWSAASASAATVAAGEAQSCAIYAGALKCWGADSIGGHLGTGANLSPSDTADLQQVAGMTTGVAGVQLTSTGGGSGTTGCALKDGGISCWGSNGSGQFGNGTTTPAMSPVPATGLGSGVTEIALGTSRACAVQGGAAKCWGGNTGDGTGDSSLSPVTPKYANGGDHAWPPNPVTPLTGGVVDVAAGWRHVCAIWNNAAVCSGDNTNGQLGYGADPMTYDGKYRYHMRPLQFPGALPSPPVQIVAGVDVTCVRLQNGSAWCWGSNNAGRLGRGTFSLPEDANITPAQVVGLDAGVTDLAANSGHVCAIKSGTAWCWGEGANGRLGGGAMDDRHTPVQVQGLSNVTSIAVGGAHSCAEANGGRKYCWGRNNHYQLGNDAVSQSAVPMEVVGATPKPPAPPVTPKAPSSSVTPPVVVPTPSPPRRLAASFSVKPSTKLSRTRYATIAVITCPTGASCRVSAARTVKLKIRRKTYRAAVSGTGALRGGRKATVKVRLSRAAKRRLGRRTVTVALPLTVVVNGVTSRRTVSVKVTGR